MADVRNYTVNYNVTSNSSQAKADLEQFVAKLEAGSVAARSMSTSMKEVAAAQRALAESMGRAMNLRAPMEQMRAFQSSAANMIRNISKSFTAMASGNASELEKAMGKLTTQGFTRVSKDWNKMTGTVRSEMKETGKVLSEHEKAINTHMRNIASAYQLLAKEGQLGVMSESGRKRAFSKDARALYADLKDRNMLTKKGLETYIGEQSTMLAKAQEKVTNERLKAAKNVASAMGTVAQDTKNYARGLNLAGNFNEQADQFRKAVSSITRLSKLSGIGEKNNFAISLKVTGVDAAIRQINTLDAALKRVKANANIQVKVSTKGASKNFTQGVRDLRGMLTQANRVMSSVAAGEAKGILRVPAIAEVVGSEKGARPVPVEGVIERVVNATKKVAGEVPVDGIVEFVKAAKKVAGEVGVNGIVEFVKGAKKVVGEVGVEGIITAAKNANNFLAKVNSEAFITAAKNAEGFLAKVNAEAFINTVKSAEGLLAKVNAEGIVTSIKSGKGLKPIPIEVIPQIKNPEKVAKSITGGKPIPVSIRPEWHKDKNGKTAIDSLVSRVGKKIPPIELTLNTEAALTKFRQFIAEVRRFREININLNARANAKYTTPKAGGTSTQPASVLSGGTTTQGTAGNRPPAGTRGMQNTRKQIMRSSAYPLVGNTSFGVQTPAFVSMAKGMVGMMGIGAAFGLIGDAMQQAVEYQNTMMSVKAILESNKRYTGYTADNFREMEKNIRRVGMDTKFTAPEVAGAARFMAMAGLSVEQINNSIRPIADVALIGDNDLETTADKITNIQTAFKLGKDPKSMRKLADNLTTTFTRFNTDMMMTAEAMQYAAPVASAAGLGIEDTLAMIGVMGNAGIQASMAGTTLRMAMQNIIKPNKNQKKLWEKLGISRHNADGSPRNIVDVLTELREKTSDAQLMEIVSNLFRTTSMAGTVQIVRNLDLLKSAREDMILGRDEGLSSKLSGEKQNTIKGLWAQVTSAFTEDNVLMFEKFQGKLKEMLMDIRDYLKTPEAIQNLEHIIELIKTMGSAFGTVIKVWMDLYNTFPGAVKAMMVMQLAMSQIGMLLNPFIGLFRVARNIGISTGMLGAAGAAGAVGAAGSAGIAGGVFGRALAAKGALGIGMIPSAGAGNIARNAMLMNAVSGGLASQGPLVMSAAANSMAMQNAIMAGLATGVPMTRGQQIMSKFASSSFGGSFLAARSANALSISGMGRGMVSALGTVLGSIFSPIGLTIGGIAASVYLIAKYKKEERESLEKYKAKSQSNSQYIENAKKIASGNISEEALRRGISTGAIADLGNILAKDNQYSPGVWRSNPQFRHTKGFSHIFTGDIARHNGTAAAYINDMYEQFVKPTTGMSKSEYLSKVTGGRSFDETNVDEYNSVVTEAAARLAIPGAMKIMSANSVFYRRGESKILSMFENASKIADKEKRRDAFSDAYINANKYLQSLLPTGTETQLSNIGDINRIGTMKASELAGTYEYKMGLYENLKQLLDDNNNTQMAPYIGLMKLDNLTVDQFNKRIDILAGITKIAQVSLPDVNGVMQNIQMKFDNGIISYANFISVLEAYNIKVGQNFQTYLNMISGVFDTMLRNPMYAGYISESDRGAFMVAQQGLYKGRVVKKSEFSEMEKLAKGYAAAHGIDFNWWNQRNANGSRRWMNSTDLAKIHQWRYGKKESGGISTTGLNNIKTGENTVGGIKNTVNNTVDQSGYANHYQRSAARPTQIVFNIDKLVNIDKTEFKSVEEQELLSKLEFVVAQASTQLAATAAAQLSAIGSTGGDTQDMG